MAEFAAGEQTGGGFGDFLVNLGKKAIDAEFNKRYVPTQPVHVVAEPGQATQPVGVVPTGSGGITTGVMIAMAAAAVLAVYALKG